MYKKQYNNSDYKHKVRIKDLCIDQLGFKVYDKLIQYVQGGCK